MTTDARNRCGSWASCPVMWVLQHSTLACVCVQMARSMSAAVGMSCVLCVIVCYSQMTFVDALVSYHRQRQRAHDRLTTTTSPRVNHLPAADDDDDDDNAGHRRQHQRPATRRMQSVHLQPRITRIISLIVVVILLWHNAVVRSIWLHVKLKI